MSAISEKMIPVEKARELQKNWINNQGRAIETSRGSEDVRDFLFDLEELQEYLNLVRSTSKEQGIENPGIRIFFGAYAEDKKYATIFLSATKDVTSKGDISVMPLNTENSDNYDIMPLNTVMGGFPPIEY